jgi:hypothetical protein
LLFPLKKRTSTRYLPPPNIIHPSAQGANLRILLSRNTKKTRESLLQGLTPLPNCHSRSSPPTHYQPFSNRRIEPSRVRYQPTNIAPPAGTHSFYILIS